MFRGLPCLPYGLMAGLAIGYYVPALAQTSVDPYTLCAQSPENSVCQPYHLDPVALEERSGEEVLACVLRVGETEELKGACKYSIATDQLIAYIEEDPELESLDGEKPTRVVSVPTGNIVKLVYAEDTIDSPALRDIFRPVRGARRVLRQPKEVALMTAVFPMRAENAQQPMPVTVTLVVDQEDGSTVRAQFETATGLPSEAPPTGK